MSELFCEIILISGLVFTTEVLLEVLEKIHEKLTTFCSDYGLIYIDNIEILHNAQKLKFSFKDFFSKYDQIRRKLVEGD